MNVWNLNEEVILDGSKILGGTIKND